MLHVDIPTRIQIDKLAGYRGGPAVSIYLRTTPLTQDTKADRIELKNLLKAALTELEAVDTPKRSIWPIAQSVEALIEDDEFWASQANSLAIFVTPESIRTFRLPNRLTSMAEVSDRFHLKPLLRSITFPHNAYVLAIGIGAARLIEVSADLPPHAVSVPGMPRDLGQALGKRSHIERDGAMRSGEATSEHAMLSRYARAIDQSLRPVLAGHDQPLIIAASEPLASIFRSVSAYPHIPASVIAGSPDDVTDHLLAAAARDVLDEVYAGEMRALADLYAERANQGRATADIAQAARAATFGAVDTLIVEMDVVISGTVSDDDGKVTFDAEPDAVNYGVIDEIARRVLQSGGRVVSARQADVPGGGELAAVLRYPV